MPAPHGSIAYEWPAQSIPYPLQSHPESEQSSRSAPLWRRAEERCAMRPTSRRFLRTSKHGRFLRATPGFRFASSLRPAFDRRCRCPSRTSERLALVHSSAACIESETSDIVRLSAELVVRFETERPLKAPTGVRRGVSRHLQDERIESESPVPLPLPW